MSNIWHVAVDDWKIYRDKKRRQKEAIGVIIRRDILIKNLRSELFDRYPVDLVLGFEIPKGYFRTIINGKIRYVCEIN